jgi:hypothetical protein
MNSNTKISLVAGTRKYDFVKQLLREQHCLPIACHRVQALFCAHQPSWIAKQTLPRQLPKSVPPQSTDYFTASSTVKRLLQFLLPPVPHVHYFLRPRSRDSTPLACSLLLTVTLFYECKL